MPEVGDRQNAKSLLIYMAVPTGTSPLYWQVGPGSDAGSSICGADFRRQTLPLFPMLVPVGWVLAQSPHRTLRTTELLFGLVVI